MKLNYKIDDLLESNASLFRQLPTELTPCLAAIYIDLRGNVWTESALESGTPGKVYDGFQDVWYLPGNVDTISLHELLRSDDLQTLFQSLVEASIGESFHNPGCEDISEKIKEYLDENHQICGMWGLDGIFESHCNYDLAASFESNVDRIYNEAEEFVDDISTPAQRHYWKDDVDEWVRDRLKDALQSADS